MVVIINFVVDSRELITFVDRLILKQMVKDNSKKRVIVTDRERITRQDLSFLMVNGCGVAVKHQTRGLKHLIIHLRVGVKNFVDLVNFLVAAD